MSLITPASGQLIGPDSLGTFRFQRIGAPTIPALGPFASWILGTGLLVAGTLRLSRSA